MVSCPDLQARPDLAVAARLMVWETAAVGAVTAAAALSAAMAAMAAPDRVDPELFEVCLYPFCSLQDV